MALTLVSNNNNPVPVPDPEWDTSLAFVDWLSVKRPNHGAYDPLPVDKFLRLDPDGTVVYETVGSFNHRGSHDSSAQIRVTPDTLSVSFNPSKWNRPDNLFGLTWEQSLVQVDALLASLQMAPLGSDFSVTKIDLTLNVETGSPENLKAFYRALARQRLPRSKLKTEDNTIYWNKKSAWKAFKAYMKHVELLAHWKTTLLAARPWVLALSKWCEEVGLIRFEVRYGRNFLRHHNLRSGANITHQKLVDLFKGDLAKMPIETKDILADNLSNAVRGTLTQWMVGYPPKDNLSKNCFYNHRRAILAATGCDISLPCPADYQRMVDQLGRIIKTKAATPPNWYYQNLRQVEEA